MRYKKHRQGMAIVIWSAIAGVSGFWSRDKILRLCTIFMMNKREEEKSLRRAPAIFGRMNKMQNLSNAFFCSYSQPACSGQAAEQSSL
jgi:hypothetical protein